MHGRDCGLLRPGRVCLPWFCVNRDGIMRPSLLLEMLAVKLVVLVLALATLSTPTLAQAPHPCAVDALARAGKLIRFHLADAGMEGQIADGKVARRVADAPTLKGKGRLDVLEVTTDVYKASYRMRFLYAKGAGSCALLGQEIMEASNPY